MDSGTTKALALLGISDDFYETYSEKNMNFGSVCRYISEKGKPLIVSTDKVKSKLARRIAAAFDAKLINPREDLSVREKNELIDEFAKKVPLDVKNRHEKDALASALCTKNLFVSLFKKIDINLEKKNLSHLSEEVKELVVKGKAGNTYQAIMKLKE